MTKNLITNPFPGLRPFEMDFHHLFFGREQQVDEMIELLGQTHFMVVAGQSGSGKSSLVRAGLIPGLHGGLMIDKGPNWRVAICSPGDDPFGSLARALGSAEALGQEDEKRLRASPAGLIESAQQAGIKAGNNLFVLVDQFEEVIKNKNRTENSDRDSTAFVKLLLESSHQNDVPIHIALTIRADFLDSCSVIEGLTEAINDGSYLIPRMREEQFRDIIVKPIDARKAEIAPDLVSRMLAEIGDSQDELPVMQHALMRTWDHWQNDHAAGEPVGERHYEAIGTMKRALSQHAEEVYNEFQDDSSKRITEMLFKSLTDKTTSASGIRRPMPLNELCVITGAERADVIEVVEQFRLPGRWFLTPSPGTPLEDDSILDLTHESLIRVWERAISWMEEEVESARQYTRLANTAALYQAGKAGLYQDPDLELALNWQQQTKPTGDWAQRYDSTFERAMTFLEHSRKERDFDVAHREEQHKKRLKRARVFAMSMGALSIIFLAVGLKMLDLYYTSEEHRLEAIVQQERAVEESQKAEAQRQVAVQEQERAEQERQNAEAQRQVAIQEQERAEQERQNAEAQRQVAIQEQDRAERERQNAEKQRRVAIQEQERAEQERQNAEKQRQIAIKQKQSANRLHLLSVARSLAIQSVKIQQKEQVELGSLMALQAYVFNTRYQGSSLNPAIYTALHLGLSAFNEGRLEVLRGHEDGVRSIEFSPDGQMLVSGSDDGRLLLWSKEDLDWTGTVIKSSGAPIRSIAFSSDGKLLAEGDANGALWMWPLDRPGTPAIQIAEQTPNSTIGSLAFDNVGKYLAAGILEGEVRIWNLNEPGEPPRVPYRDQGRVYGLAFSPVEQVLVWGGADGYIRSWEAQKPDRPPTKLKYQEEQIRSVVFSPDGALLAAGTAVGDILIWNYRDPAAESITLIGHSSAITSMRFVQDGQLLVSSSLDKTVRIWNVEDPDEEPSLLEHDDWVWAASFSPDGTKIVSGSADKNAYVWTTDAKLLAEQLRGKLNRNMSIQEWDDFVGVDIPYERTYPSLPGGEGLQRGSLK